MTNREFFAQTWAAEHPRFVGVLQAAPEGQLQYRPHPRSRSAEELIGHMIGHELDLQELVETGSINHRVQVPFASLSEALETYRRAHEAVQPKLAALDDRAWDEAGRFIVGGRVVMEATRRDLAWLLLLDAIHHRGQLSAYLRPMGSTVPGIYGPSADTASAATT